MPVPGRLLASLLPSAALGQAVLLALVPHGGQRTARRNAWASMVADAQRSRAWREADQAVAAAHARTAPTRQVGG